MKKLVRNMTTPEGRSFWENSEQRTKEVDQWPAWKRAGINVAQERVEPRAVSVERSISEGDHKH